MFGLADKKGNKEKMYPEKEVDVYEESACKPPDLTFYFH